MQEKKRKKNKETQRKTEKKQRKTKTKQGKTKTNKEKPRKTKKNTEKEKQGKNKEKEASKEYLPERAPKNDFFLKQNVKRNRNEIEARNKSIFGLLGAPVNEREF